MVGDQAPTDPKILTSGDNPAELWRLSRDARILESVGALNADDLTHILFGVATQAGQAAFDEAARDPSLNTPGALRTTLLAHAKRALDSAVSDYFLYVPIFGDVVPPPVEVELCAWCSLVPVPQSWFTDRYEPVGGLGAVGLLGNLGTPGEAKAMAAWRVHCTGHLSFSAGCSTMIHGLSRARELLYLGECFDLFCEARGIILRAALGGPSDARCFVERADGSVPGQRVWGGDSVIRRAAKLLLNADPTGGLDIEHADEDDLAALHRRLKRRAQTPRPIWNAATEDADLLRLRSAIEWAFEGEHASEPSASLVESFIALEALLGEEEAESIANGRITDRLADRYAFLVGTTAMDREQKRDAFKKLYKVRGRVVHGNQSRAALAHDFTSRYEAIVMAKAAITEEAKRYLHAYTHQLALALRARTPSAS